MKRECPHCQKVSEFEYWESELTYVNYPMDQEGHVFCGERKEFPDKVVKRFLECGHCGRRAF